MAAWLAGKSAFPQRHAGRRSDRHAYLWVGRLALGGFTAGLFISSSLLSKLFSARKREVSEKFAKGSRRDWGQVFANGALGAFLVVIHLLFPEDAWPWLAYAGAMATVNADTWATELGVLSPVLPRLITSGKQVPPGTSGGISFTGTTATFAGGALIGLVGWLFDSSLPGLPFILVVAVAGLFGSLVDSLLGATVQAIYYDPVRDKETERRIFNEDGTLAAPIRGTDWMNNDMVNLIAGMAGALAAAALWQWWFV